MEMVVNGSWTSLNRSRKRSKQDGATLVERRRLCNAVPSVAMTYLPRRQQGGDASTLQHSDDPKDAANDRDGDNEETGGDRADRVRWEGEGEERSRR